MVAGYRIGKHRELRVVNMDIERSLIEAKVNDRIDLENCVLGIIVPWCHGVWPILARGDLVGQFSGTLLDLT